MELLFQILFELLIGGSLDFAMDDETPKFIRIGLLIFVSLFYSGMSVLFLCLLWITDSILLKVFLLGIVLFFIYMFVSLWRKVLRAKR